MGQRGAQPDEFDEAEGDAIAARWAAGGCCAATCDVDSRARRLREVVPWRRSRVPISTGILLSAVPMSEVALCGLVVALARAGPSGPPTRGRRICLIGAARKPLGRRALGVWATCDELVSLERDFDSEGFTVQFKNVLTRTVLVKLLNLTEPL